MGLGLKTFWQAFFCPETGQDSILLLKQLIRSVSKPGDTPDRIWKKSALRDRLPPQTNNNTQNCSKPQHGIF